MRNITIEWRHYDKAGQTCERCSATGFSVKDVLAEVRDELAESDVELSFIETLLCEEDMAESNMILFNGVPLEDVLDNAAADENHCQSCSCMTGSKTSCRTIQYAGENYEEIPVELIRTAIYKVAGIK